MATPRLPRITGPILVASSAFDGIAPPENGAAIAARSRGSLWRLYDGGHGFFVQGLTVIPEVIDFLRTER